MTALRARVAVAVWMSCGVALAQGRTILRAYAGTDGRAHVVLRNGSEYVAPKEGSTLDGDEQQDVEEIRVSEMAEPPVGSCSHPIAAPHTPSRWR